MKVVRMIVWVLLLAALLVFSMANWDARVTVRIWEDLVVDTNVPALMIGSLLIGLVPMWLIHRASKWQMKRRIASLENAALTVSTMAPADLASPRPAPPLDNEGPLASPPGEQEQIAP